MDPSALPVNPQARQKPHIDHWTPRLPCARPHPFIKRAQVHLPGEFPDGPRRMIFSNELLHVDHGHAHLLPIDPLHTHRAGWSRLRRRCRDLPLAACKQNCLILFCRLFRHVAIIKRYR